MSVDYKCGVPLDQFREADPGNYTPGREGVVDRVVIHIADGSYEGTLAWIADPASPASAHYTVAQDGRIGQSVSEANTAWHSGKWAMNARSIGIEHEGRQNAAQPWVPSETQLHASAGLVADICKRHGIPVDRTHIIGHSEVDPTRAARANCPGKGWPWEKYLALVRRSMGMAAPAQPTEAHQPEKVTLRLFDPATNKQIGLVTLLKGTDKAYLKQLDRGGL